MRQIGVPLLLAILATALATPILLVRYRLRLSAWMARRADDALPAEPPLAHRPAPLPSANALLGRSRSAVRARARAWFAGFAAQALVLTAIVATGFGSRLSGPALLVVLAVLLLPAALVLLTASAASGWTRLLGLFAGLLPVLVWPGPAGELLRSMAQLYVLVPLLPLLLFHLRFWRGAAPQVFLLSLCGFNGWLLVFGLAKGGLGISDGPLLGLLRLLGLAAGLAVGLLALRRVAERQVRRGFSDQAFALDCWWFLYSLVQALLVCVNQGLGAGALALLSYPLGRWIAGIARGGAAGPEAPPLRLLLLRVFGNSQRSERLFEQLQHAWLPIGSIELIGGTDLALQQVTPLDFLAFLTGRLRDRFGQGPAETDLRLAKPPLPNAEGTYQAHQTFCHADGWETTMRRLLAASDAVLMDLRQFRAERAGCRVELEALARCGGDRPRVLVTDASTDLNLLRQVLSDSGADVDTAPWHIVTASAREADTVSRILQAIATP